MSIVGKGLSFASKLAAKTPGGFIGKSPMGRKIRGAAAKITGDEALFNLTESVIGEKRQEGKKMFGKAKSIDRLIVENEIKLIYGVKKRGKAKKSKKLKK